MRKGSTMNLMALLCALLLLSSVGGVFAIWVYANGPVEAKNDHIALSLSEFIWEPEDILPTETPGKNYLDLLDSILNNQKGGLNSKKDTLEAAVRNYHIVHCEQNVPGGNLKHLRDLFTEKSNKLDFLVQYITDDEFHVYMFETDDVESGTVNVTQIKVYKAIVAYDGTRWDAKEAQFGYTTLRYLASNDSYVAIDPTEWVQGSLPA